MITKRISTLTRAVITLCLLMAGVLLASAQFNPIVHDEFTTNWPPKAFYLSTVPPGAWYTNNLSVGATFIQPTNSGDAWAFAASATQAIRVRYAFAPLWDGLNVYAELSTLCSGTNHALSTNVVWGIKGASLNYASDESNPTFGTEVFMTNHIISENVTFRKSLVIIGPITVGNSPNATNDVLWQIERTSPGPGSSDTETNTSLCLMQVKFFYTLSLTNKPTVVPSP